jgi:hypothetical protein
MIEKTKSLDYEENMQNIESVLMLKGVKQWQCGVAVNILMWRTMVGCRACRGIVHIVCTRCTKTIRMQNKEEISTIVESDSGV